MSESGTLGAIAMSRILVVGDTGCVPAALVEMFAAAGHEIVFASNTQSALDRLRTGEFDLVIVDIRIPAPNGLETLAQIKGSQSKLPLIVLADQSRIDTAIEATQRGALEYQLTPIDAEALLKTVEKALAGVRLMTGHVSLGRKPLVPASDALIGQSAALQQVYKAIERVAQTDATVLIRGEPGTGKELVARAIYQQSLRSAAPLLRVNCAAIAKGLLESELFGHEKGAFSGAVTARIGKLEQADGASLLLDEIGSISLNVQAKILRFLRAMEFERVGGTETLRADVRLLVATNRDLEIASAGGAFREDLYYRLRVVTIHIPPLRERREDIPQLVDYFLERWSHEIGAPKPRITADAVARLQERQWPGNVRQLQHVIQRAMVARRGQPIEASGLRFLEDDLEQAEPVETSSLDDDRLLDIVQRYLSLHGGSRVYDSFLGKVERFFLTEALRRSHGNQTHAATLLGLARPTFHAKVRRHNLQGKEPPGQLTKERRP
jgi:DNA-binding NtrC family response regulator